MTGSPKMPYTDPASSFYWLKKMAWWPFYFDEISDSILISVLVGLCGGIGVMAVGEFFGLRPFPFFILGWFVFGSIGTIWAARRKARQYRESQEAED